MTTISIRDLGRRRSQVVDEVIRTGRPAVITRYGRPVAGMVAIDPDDLENFVLARAAGVRALRGPQLLIPDPPNAWRDSPSGTDEQVPF